MTRGPPPAQEAEHETPGSASVRNQETSGGGPLHDSISPTIVSCCTPSTTRKGSGLSSHEGKKLDPENVVPAKGAEGAGLAATKAGSTRPSENNVKMIANVPAAAALAEVKGSEPSNIGQALAVGVEQEGKSDRPRIRAADRSSVGLSVQQQPQEARQEGAHNSMDGGGIASEEDAAASEKEAGPHPSGTTTARGAGALEMKGLAPALKLSLPWHDEEGGPGLACTRKIGGESAQTPAAGASGGGVSARTVGAGGSAAAGLTYPGPRPLSAPLVRPSITASHLNATSPILSGRRFEGTSVDLGGSRNLGRTAGASLAGRLLSYATRPGGTFDVFAAARDGQVGTYIARSMSSSVGIAAWREGDDDKAGEQSTTERWQLGKPSESTQKKHERTSTNVSSFTVPLSICLRQIKRTPDLTQIICYPGKRIEASADGRGAGGRSGRSRPDRAHVGSPGGQALHRQVPRVSGGEPGAEGRSHRVLTLALRGLLLQVPSDSVPMEQRGF